MSAKIIFVTSTVYNGSLGGLAGADAKCVASATARFLPGYAVANGYKAWLSDSTATATGRLAHSPSPYVLVDGTLVANDWAQLTSGTLQHAISLTELGTALPANATTNTCGMAGQLTVWTISTATAGAWGNPAGSAAQWTQACGGTGPGEGCNLKSALYCIQQ